MMNGDSGDKLRAAYQRIADAIPSLCESFSSVQLVQAYREFWRPIRTRVVLLAESHVYTSEDDRRRTHRLGILDLPDYPEQFARFVYCLGCGEDQIVRPPLAKNPGTPQFWKIFYSCLSLVRDNSSFKPILKSGCPLLQDRLKNKISLLREMQGRGVWLVDASIVALYVPNYTDTYQLPKSLAIDISWNEFVGPLLKSLSPGFVIVIGKGVGDVVGDRVKKIVGNRFSVTEQPQARLTSEEHMRNYQKYYQICREHCGGGNSGDTLFYSL